MSQVSPSQLQSCFRRPGSPSVLGSGRPLRGRPSLIRRVLGKGPDGYREALEFLAASGKA